MTLRVLRTETSRTDTLELAPDGSVTLKVTETDGKVTKVQLSGKGPFGGHPVVVHPSFWTFIREANPFSGAGDLKQHLNDTQSVDAIAKAYANGDVVWLDVASHMVYTLDGQPVPFARSFDYVGSVFTNVHLDLVAAAAYLREHPWTVNKKTLEVTRVPAYNNEFGDLYYLPVTLLMDAGTYAEMWAVAKTDNPTDPVQALRDMQSGTLRSTWKRDWLGIHPYLNEDGRAELEDLQGRLKTVTE